MGDSFNFSELYLLLTKLKSSCGLLRADLLESFMKTMSKERCKSKIF